VINDDLIRKAVLEAFALISEQVQDASQEEKEKQQAISNTIDDEGIRKKKSSKDEVEEDEEGTEEDTGDKKSDSLDLVKKKEDKDNKFSYEIPEKMPKNVQFKDVLHQLNALRSGASTKDSDVKQGLLKYFDNLDSDEKQELFSMMAGFATIMNKAGDVEDAPMPDDIKKPKGKDDTKVQPVKKAGNAPIVVGENSQKLSELMIVLENTKEKHRCINGKLVPFASTRAIKDIEGRISDAESSRNTCSRGSEARSHYNGLLKYLRMQLRAAQKVNGS
tara:strand:+ start:28390 stop:29217 length:828 start_codon:yes stop_codon:yes gene_type:complete